jgi:DNA-binding phage protein
MTTATAIENENAQNTTYHDRRLARRLEDPEFRAEFEREKREIETIDAIVNALDHLRDAHGLSKAQLARDIGKNEASIRRLLTAPVNPELRTVVAIADALDADVMIVPRKGRRRLRRRAGAAA